MYITHSITPLQTKNERDFSLEGIYNASHRSNISVKILSDLLFINRNITALVRNTPIDLFRGSLYAVEDIVGDTESNIYGFSDASDTE